MTDHTAPAIFATAADLDLTFLKRKPEPVDPHFDLFAEIDKVTRETYPDTACYGSEP